MSWIEFQLQYDLPECVSQLLSLVFVVILTQVKNQGLSNSINLNPSGIPKKVFFVHRSGLTHFKGSSWRSLLTQVRRNKTFRDVYVFVLVNCRVECVFGPQNHLSCVCQQMLYMFNQKETGTKRLLTTFCLQSVREKICKVGNLTVKQCHSYIVIRHMIEKHWKDLDVWLPRQLQHLRTIRYLDPCLGMFGNDA